MPNMPRESSHNQNYNKPHPTDFIHGLLSLHVHTNTTAGDNVHFTANTNSVEHQYNNSQYNDFLKDWRVHKVYSKSAPHNYYSVLYVNGETKQAVLAHRGADINALFNEQHDPNGGNFIEVVNTQITLQQEETYNSTKDAVAIVNENKYNFSLTGYLFGAWLSELSFYFCYMKCGCDVLAGQVKVVTFDSPGTNNLMESFKSSIKNKDTEIAISEFDIVTYLSDPNLVNVHDQHIGKVYKVFPELLSPCEARDEAAMLPNICNNQDFQNALLKISWHSLNSILATFNSSTGKPNTTQYKKVLDWPCIQYASNQNDYAQRNMQIIINKICEGSCVSGEVQTNASNAINKLMPPNTYCSLATVIALFFKKGNGQLDNDYSLKYLGHYKLDPHKVNPCQTTISKTKGTPEWYLKQLSKYEELDIKNKFLEPVANQLLALRAKYTIEPPNENGMNVIVSKWDDVEDIVAEMSNLITSDDAIRKVLGSPQKTTLKETILAMQKKAAKYVKIISTNNILKVEGEKLHRSFRKIEELKTQLSRPEIYKYHMSIDVSTRHLLNCLYCMQALASYYMYNNHDGKNAREILQTSKKLAEEHVLIRSSVPFNFDTLTKEKVHTELDIITDLPEMYTGIIYLLGRTYMYDGEKSEGKKFFKLSKYLGLKLKLFEGYLSKRSGVAEIKREEIQRYITEKNYKQATKELNKSIQLYQKLKSDNTEYKEGYKPGTGKYEKYNIVIPSKDVYNQVECSEQITKYYMQLLTLSNDKAKYSEYLRDISNQFIGSDELSGMLKQFNDSNNILSRKVASILNNLGQILLTLYDQNIDFHELKDAVSEKLQITREDNFTGADDLNIIMKIFTFAEERSRNGEFTKADAHVGMKMVCERQLKKEVDEEVRIKLLNSISTHEKTSDEINNALKRVKK